MTGVSTTMRFAMLLTLANSMVDPYTILTRGGVFANVQTGNIIFGALELSDRHWVDALPHVWSLLAFIAGVAIAAHVKSGRLDTTIPAPVAWLMGAQATVLAVIGFVPASVPHNYVVVPISLLAGIQVGLFRFIGDIGYFPVATTGNIVRFILSGYDGIVEKNAQSRKAFAVYSRIVPTFAVGALIGALLTHLISVRAIWMPAALVAVTVVLLIMDMRTESQS